MEHLTLASRQLETQLNGDGKPNIPSIKFIVFSVGVNYTIHRWAMVPMNFWI